jgi:hypothetical protein
MGIFLSFWARPIYLLNQQLRSSAKVLFGSHSPASKKDACLFFRRIPKSPFGSFRPAKLLRNCAIHTVRKKQTSFDMLKDEPNVAQQGKPLSSEAMHRVFQQVS